MGKDHGKLFGVSVKRGVGVSFFIYVLLTQILIFRNWHLLSIVTIFSDIEKIKKIKKKCDGDHFLRHPKQLHRMSVKTVEYRSRIFLF